MFMIFEVKSSQDVDPRLWNASSQNSLNAAPSKKLPSNNSMEKIRSIFKPSKLTASKKTCGGIHRAWGEKLISKEYAIQKMAKNLAKAWNEHYAPSKENSSEEHKTYDRTEEEKTPDFHSIFDPITSVKNPPRLKIATGVVEDQWVRDSMQDAHFCISLKTGTLCGVLDGHGHNGKEIAEFASAKIQKYFPKILKKHKGNVHQALEELFSKVQKEIISIHAIEDGGCTAVISYIETDTNIIYTATLGDSETKLYRMIENELISIPLSCVRNWGSLRDEKRARIATIGDYRIFVDTYWKNKILPIKDDRKEVPVPARDRRIDIRRSWKSINDKYGSNVSRAFGDQLFNMERHIDVMIAKPKITSCLIMPGDFLIQACDGLYGCKELEKKEEKVIECIKTVMGKSPYEISYELVNLAKRAGSSDNITVQTLKLL